MEKTKNKKQITNRGFTLIETLVAVLILVTAIAGPLTIASKGLQTALVAKDQTTAYYLAQDAVEFVRFARDTNRLQGNNWLVGSGSGSTNLAGCVSGSGAIKCQFDSLANYPLNPASCPGGLCDPMNYDATNHYFNYNTNNQRSIFTRAVAITTPVGGSNTEASLVVTVSWSDLPGLTHTITVRENLFDWQ
ncbi:MAG: prepilin-type N-terminal cleavage/methylation domain-containing protein [Patescibacteria group bacterium]